MKKSIKQTKKLLENIEDNYDNKIINNIFLKLITETETEKDNCIDKLIFSSELNTKYIKVKEEDQRFRGYKHV